MLKTSLLLALGTVACGAWAAPEIVARKDLDARLGAIWAGLETATPTDGGPPQELPWQPSYSPLFPEQWPPTLNMGWVRYGYAYRMEMGLADAVRISRPWVVIGFRRDRSTVTLTRHGGPRPEAADIQGFGPSPGGADAGARAALERGPQVFESCLSLASPEDLRSPRVRELRAYYAAWSSSNGAFLGLIRKDHQAFLEWLAAEAP